MKATVHVTYKAGVLDPQGQTVHQFLQNHGEARIRNVRIGKLIEFDMEEMSQEEASFMLEEISRTLLANPVVEEFKVILP